MKNISNTLYYDDYATQRQSDIRSRMEQAKREGRDLLIVSDTGSGKTKLAIDLSVELVKDNIETGIAVPLQSIVKSKDGSNDLMDFGSGRHFTDYNSLTKNAFFTVYNTFSCSAKIKTTEYLFVDEPQTLIQQANIRGVVNAELIDSSATKVYLTGTEFMLPQALGCDVIYLERRIPSTKKRIVKCYTSNDTDESIILKITEHNKGVCTKVVRVNDKKVITKMAGQLKHMGYSVATYYSADSEESYMLENKDYLLNNDYEDLRKGIFNDVDFVLCTSAMDSGVDMECNRELFLYCIGRYDYERKSRIMPHPVDVKQFSARPRLQEVVSVYVIGKFYSSTNITIDFYEGQDQLFKAIESSTIDSLDYLGRLNKMYQAPEYNTSASWTEMLLHWNIEVEHKGFLDTIDGIKISLRRDIQILKHMRVSEQYPRIIRKGNPIRIVSPNEGNINHTYELGIDLDALESDDTFIYRPSDYVQIEALTSYVVEASELGISLEPFLTGGKFKTESMRSIIDCVNAIKMDNILGLAIKKIIREGIISKDELRLLEGEAAKLESFLKRYFKVNRNAFNRAEFKNIIVKGLKDTDKMPPTELIEYLKDVESVWLNPLVSRLNNKSLEQKKVSIEDTQIEGMNIKPLGQLSLI